MRKRINFTLNLIPLASGGWNFDLQVLDPAWIADGYFSPLASYIDEERAITNARRIAAQIALSAGGTIGRFQVTSDRSDRSDKSDGASPGGSHAVQN